MISCKINMLINSPRTYVAWYWGLMYLSLYFAPFLVGGQGLAVLFRMPLNSLWPRLVSSSQQSRLILPNAEDEPSPLTFLFLTFFPLHYIFCKLYFHAFTSWSKMTAWNLVIVSAFQSFKERGAKIPSFENTLLKFVHCSYTYISWVELSHMDLPSCTGGWERTSFFPVST